MLRRSGLEFCYRGVRPHPRSHFDKTADADDLTSRDDRRVICLEAMTNSQRLNNRDMRS